MGGVQQAFAKYIYLIMTVPMSQGDQGGEGKKWRKQNILKGCVNQKIYIFYILCIHVKMSPQDIWSSLRF